MARSGGDFRYYNRFHVVSKTRQLASQRELWYTLAVLAPIAQRIERRPPEPGALVRVQLGVQADKDGGCFSNDAEAATVFVVVLFGRSGGSDYRNACQKKIRIITSASAASKALEANTPTT